MCRGDPSAHGRISALLSAGVFPHDLADLPRVGPGRMCSTVRPAPMLHSGLATPRSVAATMGPVDPDHPVHPVAWTAGWAAGARSDRRPRSLVCVGPPPHPGSIPIKSRTPHASHVSQLGPVHPLRDSPPEREMALWEDRSTPHSTMLPPEPRNHAETPGRIRGADPNDPPRAPELGASGVRAPVDAADSADAIPAGPAAGARGVHPARGRSAPLGLPPPSSPRRRG